jgi:DNA-binding NarL/FixJ family response regulator
MTTSAPAPRRILIVDDHGIVRHGIGVLLSAATDLTVCGEASTYDEALAAMQQLQPDAVVVDLILHDRSGLDLIRAARAEGLTMPMLALSMHDEATHAEKTLRAGAQGYVMKEDADEVLVDALRKVLAGDLYMSGDINARLLRTYIEGEEDGPSGIDELTEREKEIFECLGRGLTTRKIAEQFGLSARTVEVHRARIKKKMKSEDAAQLLREAVKWVESRDV